MSSDSSIIPRIDNIPISNNVPLRWKQTTRSEAQVAHEPVAVLIGCQSACHCLWLALPPLLSSPLCLSPRALLSAACPLLLLERLPLVPPLPPHGRPAWCRGCGACSCRCGGLCWQRCYCGAILPCAHLSPLAQGSARHVLAYLVRDRHFVPGRPADRRLLRPLQRRTRLLQAQLHGQAGDQSSQNTHGQQQLPQAPLAATDGVAQEERLLRVNPHSLLRLMRCCGHAVAAAASRCCVGFEPVRSLRWSDREQLRRVRADVQHVARRDQVLGARGRRRRAQRNGRMRSRGHRAGTLTSGHTQHTREAGKQEQTRAVGGGTREQAVKQHRARWRSDCAGDWWRCMLFLCCLSFFRFPAPGCPGDWSRAGCHLLRAGRRRRPKSA